MNIFPKGSKLYSIFYGKCPRCHKGDVFTTSHPYHLKKIFELKKNCSHCGLLFEREPGFFFGAMYVSYAYTVAIAVAVYILMSFFFEPDIFEYLISLSVVLLLGSPFIFRISRITWMNLFTKYRPEERDQENL